MWALRKFAASVSCEEVTPAEQLDDAVFHLIVVADEHGERLCRLEPDELDMFQHRIAFRGDDKA